MRARACVCVCQCARVCHVSECVVCVRACVCQRARPYHSDDTTDELPLDLSGGAGGWGRRGGGCYSLHSYGDRDVTARCRCTVAIRFSSNMTTWNCTVKEM